MEFGGAGVSGDGELGTEEVREATPVGEPLLDSDPTPVEAERPSDARRRWTAGVAGLTVAVLLAIGFVVSRSDDTPPPKPDIPLDAWAPYWTLDASVEVAPQRLGSMREISPFWYNATGVAGIEIDPNADAAAAEEFLAIARRSGAAVVPSIVDALPVGGMAAILADPETRARHVDAIVAFAEDGDFDGIDLDYEQFAFADGRDTWEATRPNWVAFVEELGERLRSDGRTLTVSIPFVYDAERTASSGYWVYDHGAIAPHVDRIRIMAYDYSVGDPGPIAPLDFVQRAIDGTVDAVGSPDKLVLGLPAYGRNWPVSTAGTCPPDTELDGVISVNNRTVDELIERRSATPTFDESTGEWSFTYDVVIGEGETQCVQTRQVNYVDADGVRLRMDMARAAQLDGVALWAFGFDDAAVWDAILPTTSGAVTTGD
jgi:spore germination protein YaaH